LLNILTLEQEYLLFTNTLPIFIPEMTKKENDDTVSEGRNLYIIRRQDFSLSLRCSGFRHSNPPAAGAGKAAAAACLRDHLYLCADALLERRDMRYNADKLAILL